LRGSSLAEETPASRQTILLSILMIQVSQSVVGMGQSIQLITVKEISVAIR